MNLFDVYPLFNINIVKGSGCTVWDDKARLILTSMAVMLLSVLGMVTPIILKR